MPIPPRPMVPTTSYLFAMRAPGPKSGAPGASAGAEEIGRSPEFASTPTRRRQPSHAPMWRATSSRSATSRPSENAMIASSSGHGELVEVGFDAPMAPGHHLPLLRERRERFRRDAGAHLGGAGSAGGSP